MSGRVSLDHLGKCLRLVWTLSLMSALLTVGTTASHATDLRLECDADGPNDTSLNARYEERDSGRKKFSAEFEAAPGGPFAVGQRMVVAVDGVRVGAVRLKVVTGGDLVGDLNLDTTAGPGDDSKPFPPDFPPVVSGTRVAVRINGDRVLGCRLR